MPEHPTRRRVLTIFGMTAAGLAMVRAGPLSSVADYEWRGTAMGAEARMLFCGGDPRTISAAVQAAAAEIDRLEDALSLFRDHSEICRVNRDGMLLGPCGDFRRALELALAVAAASGGLFDPTVQALWEAHVDWFAAGQQASLPSEALIAAASKRVDWRRILVEADRVRLGPGQRITLNGLGQGFVTDRVADLLRGHGFGHVLVDLGEQRALGPRADGTPWLVARVGSGPIELRDGALATSEGAGCIIGAEGQAHHLFDPRSGRSANRWSRVSVAHRSAAVADALSTALYAASPAEITAVLEKFPGAQAWVTGRGGQERHFSIPRPT